MPMEADVPGARQYSITSDDLFSLKRAPGKTLIVGASYIALECAGFLMEMGFETKVAVRSILLRGFDRQCAEKIGSNMENMGCIFYRECVPTRIVKTEEGKLRVEFNNSTYGTEEFDTVIYAAGRLPQINGLGLDNAGIAKNASGKIVCDSSEQTSVAGIYAIGDTVQGRPELTPVAIRAGELLARRLFANRKELMDYTNIATTVFTPVEYGCCGLSEEDAIAKYGEANVETYLFEFNPVEVSAAHWRKAESVIVDEYDVDMPPINLSKLVCVQNGDRTSQKVVGFHCVGLNAGETTQGYALAIKAGITKEQFDEVVGIHPTDAESFHTMTVTRRSGESWVAAGGCGGGKCG